MGSPVFANIAGDANRAFQFGNASFFGIVGIGLLNRRNGDGGADLLPERKASEN
jgi:hypothetical protein